MSTKKISLKEAVESASKAVENSPEWLKEIYDRNEKLEQRCEEDSIETVQGGSEMSTIILRVVARGERDETEDFDMDDPSDLVALEEINGVETEIERKEFETGHAASKYLCSLLKKKD